MIKRLILFDIDGTLLISKGIGREAKRRAMLEVFGEAGDIDNYAFGGKTDWHILADLLEPFGITVDDVGEKLPHYQGVMARYVTEIRKDFVATPCPYAMELVQELRKHPDVLLGIVTGNVSTVAPIKLEMAGFDPAWFPIGAYGNESPKRADLPHLAIERAQKYCGHPLPFNAQDVIVIGDTPDDILAARSVDATVVAVCTGFSERNRLICADPDFLLRDLSTFMELIAV